MLAFLPTEFLGSSPVGEMGVGWGVYIVFSLLSINFYPNSH